MPVHVPGCALAFKRLSDGLVKLARLAAEGSIHWRDVDEVLSLLSTVRKWCFFDPYWTWLYIQKAYYHVLEMDQIKDQMLELGPEAVTPSVQQRLTQLLYMVKWETQEALVKFNAESKGQKPMLQAIDAIRQKVKTTI